MSVLESHVGAGIHNAPSFTKSLAAHIKTRWVSYIMVTDFIQVQSSALESRRYSTKDICVLEIK
jgi:hypothetical protein